MALFIFLNGCVGVQSRYHHVHHGDTKEKIASRYGVGLSELEKYNRGIDKGIRVGDKVYIPFETIPGWNDGDEELETAEPNSHLAGTGQSSSRELSSLSPRFNWPVYGSLSSKFGRRRGENHDGIDIAAPKGTQVLASRSGHVIYSGNKISGYGNLVIVRHPDSYATVYAHLSKILVRKGQFVSRGQKIGRVGATGRATGPHLHFEVRNQSYPTDPLALLPNHSNKRN